MPHTNAGFTDVTDNPANALAADTLDPPTSLAASSGANVILDWTATVDTYATGHRIYRSTSSGGPYIQIAQITPRTTTTRIESPADGTYYYVLRAHHMGWESADSDEAAATSIGVMYLHNNPSPPTGDTGSQDLLPSTPAPPPPRAFTTTTRTATFSPDS